MLYSDTFAKWKWRMCLMAWAETLNYNIWYGLFNVHYTISEPLLHKYTTQLKYNSILEELHTTLLRLYRIYFDNYFLGVFCRIWSGTTVCKYREKKWNKEY